MPRRSSSSRSGRSARSWPGGAATRSRPARRSAARPARRTGWRRSHRPDRVGAGLPAARTARPVPSARPSKNARRSRPTAQHGQLSSFRNRPATDRGQRAVEHPSPRVLIGTSSTCRPGWAWRRRSATCSLCQRASGLLRWRCGRFPSGHYRAFGADTANGGAPRGWGVWLKQQPCWAGGWTAQGPLQVRPCSSVAASMRLTPLRSPPRPASDSFRVRQPRKIKKSRATASLALSRAWLDSTFLPLR